MLKKAKFNREGSPVTLLLVINGWGITDKIYNSYKCYIILDFMMLTYCYKLKLSPQQVATMDNWLELLRRPGIMHSVSG